MDAAGAGRGRTRRARDLWIIVGSVSLVFVVVLGVVLVRILWEPPPAQGCGYCGAPPLAASPAMAGGPYTVSGATFYPYQITIQSVGTAETGRDLTFVLEDANGTPVAFSFVALIDASGCWVGSYTTAWASGSPASSPPGASVCAAGGPTLSGRLVSGDGLLLVTPRSISASGFSLKILSPVMFGSVSVPVT